MTDVSDLRQQLMHNASWDSLGLDMAVSVDTAMDEFVDWLRENATQLQALADVAETQKSCTILTISAEAVDTLADSLTVPTKKVAT